MGKLRFVLSNFWLWATLLLGCFYAENLAIFSPNPRDGYNTSTFLMLTICCFLCLGVYLYLEHRRNKVKFDKILLPIIIGLGIVMLATIFMQNSETFVFENGKDSITVSFSVGRKLKYGLRLIFLLGFSYATTFVMFANRTSNRSLLWLPVLLLAVVYVSVGYSLFSETSVIVSYFRSVAKQPIKSFFLNPNTFGQTLLLGIMACFVINIYKPNAFTYLSIPFFMFLLILTLSAASILVAFAIVPIYFVVEIFRNIKKHFLPTVLISAFVIIAFAAFGVIIAQLADQDNLFVENVISSIRYFIDTLDFNTYTGRTRSFDSFVKYGSDSVIHTIFGRGYGTSDEYIPAMYTAIRNGGPHSVSCENGFIQVFITFGLVGLLAYICLLALFFYSCVKLFINRYRTFSLIYALCVLGLIANCFAETNVFFDLGFKETSMTLIFLMPPIVKAKFLSRKAKVEETKQIQVKSKFDAKKVGTFISMIFMALIASTAACFLSPYAMNNPQVYYIVIAGLAGGLIIFPYLIAMWLKSRDSIMRVIHVSLNLIALFAFVYVAFVIGKNNNSAHNYIYSGTAAFVFIVLDIILYAVIRKDFFVSYLKITFINPLVATFPSYLCGFGLTIVFILVTMPFGAFGAMETFGIGIFFFIATALGAFFIPYRPMKRYLNYLNDATISRWKTFMLRGDR